MTTLGAHKNWTIFVNFILKGFCDKLYNDIKFPVELRFLILSFYYDIYIQSKILNDKNTTEFFILDNGVLKRWTNNIFSKIPVRFNDKCIDRVDSLWSVNGIVLTDKMEMIIFFINGEKRIKNVLKIQQQDYFASLYPPGKAVLYLQKNKGLYGYSGYDSHLIVKSSKIIDFTHTSTHWYILVNELGVLKRLIGTEFRSEKYKWCRLEQPDKIIEIQSTKIETSILTEDGFLYNEYGVGYMKYESLSNIISFSKSSYGMMALTNNGLYILESTMSTLLNHPILDKIDTSMLYKITSDFIYVIYNDSDGEHYRMYTNTKSLKIKLDHFINKPH